MAESLEIKEGFLCPVCHVDLGTAVALMSHFEDNHSGEQDILKPFKGFLGKAKKILNKDPSISGPGQQEMNQPPNFKFTPGYEQTVVSECDLGAVNSHTEYFKMCRVVRVERYAVQTNHLLFRLQKLLHNLPSDPVKRKVHEQDVVPWIDEKEVKLCPGCAKTFNLLRRKHHCRLCGGVMCNECTFLLTLDNARRMIDVADEETDRQQQRLTKSSSSFGVQSVISIDHVQDSHIRLCEYCNNCLLSRERLRESRTLKPIICQFYTRLTSYMSEADDLLKVYLNINKSLRSGETFHSLSEAQSLRDKLIKLSDNIDTTSKKIAVLGQSTDSPPLGIQLQLHKTIRVAAMLYLKDNLIGLPSLPTKEQLEQIQDDHRLQIAKRLDEEERRAAEALQKISLSSITRNITTKLPKNTNINSNRAASTPRQPKIRKEDGWTPGQLISVTAATQHPLIQQINIVKDYMKQAERLGKREEVQMLEENLKQLNEEYFRQCQTDYKQ